jgi:hypothetical protein
LAPPHSMSSAALSRASRRALQAGRARYKPAIFNRSRPGTAVWMGITLALREFITPDVYATQRSRSMLQSRGGRDPCIRHTFAVKEEPIGGHLRLKEVSSHAQLCQQ